eukprot:TRINITY_DN20642_c0_g1_i1.p2 TRINITY_DN20642_c0_g1~~TRINITY_DN20642_c0_g1_i1.p2  ORF type:complete len:112 (+),score=13.88 TRINITY_DN20642_c0_g1_i1:147-482(+)
MVLFGHVQAMCCGLSEQAIPVMQGSKGLMLWMRTMHERIEGYQRMYSRRLEDPTLSATQVCRPACWLYQAGFCVGGVAMVVAWRKVRWIVLGLLVWRYTNPERSGRRLSVL